jgi:exoribonuclease R
MKVIHDLISIYTNIAYKNVYNNNKMSQNISTRMDLTDKYVFSIDPLGCTDIDDAIHFDELSNGFEIGIHIADISEYVKVGTPADLEAKQRQSSIYLPNKNITMIPRELSDTFCSLKAHQTRLALSLILHLNSVGHILNYVFNTTTICVRQNLSYTLAEEMYTKNNTTLAKLFDMCTKINIDQNNQLTILDRESYHAHYIIDTLMIVANSLCAEYLIQQYGDCILRLHSANKCQYLDTLVNQDPQLNEYLQHKTTDSSYYQTLSQCLQNNVPIKHFGLGKKYYTHFTSPIRRYVDLINHRFVKKIIGQNDINQLQSLSDLANQSEIKMKKISRDMKYLTLINRLETTHMYEIVTDGYIIDIITSTPSLQLKVYIPDYQLSTHITLIHYKLIDLYTITYIENTLHITDKANDNTKILSRYMKISLKITPIMNAESFHKKLRIFPNFKF